MDLNIPISPKRWVQMYVPLPLTEAEWECMMAILEAMKPAITTPQP